MNPSALLTFFAAVLLLQISPGPDMLLVIGRGIGQGRRIALLTVVGGTLFAGLVQLPLLALGITALLKSSPLVFSALRFVGAAYLIWLGATLLLKAQRRSAPDAKIVSAGGALWQGMVNNLSNPKALVFMLTFLPQFVDPTANWPVAAQLLLLGTLQKLTGLAVLSVIALAAGRLGAWLNRRQPFVAWQQRFTAVVMIGLGLRIALGADPRLAAQ